MRGHSAEGPRAASWSHVLCSGGVVSDILPVLDEKRQK